MSLPRLSLPCVGFVLLVLSAAAAEHPEVTRVPLVIDEPFEDRQVAWPMTTGVPFPRGLLLDEKHCRLVDDLGNEQPLQTRAVAWWLPEAASIRWLTIDFVAAPARKYFLECGKNVSRSASESELVIERAGDGARVETGAITVQFRAGGPGALESVRLNIDRDGREASETVLRTPDEGGHYFRNQHQQISSSAHDATDRRIVVESEGPVRACVRVDGFYTGPDGRRIVRYRTRHHFFAGLGLIKVIDEFKIVGPTKGTEFADIGFSLKLVGDPSERKVIVDRSGELGNQPLSIPWKKETQSVSSFQEVYRHFGNLPCRGAVAATSAQGEELLSETEHVGEWMQVVDDRAAITGSLRWFWQQFPKEWEATSDRLTLHLWSPRAGNLDFGAEGLKQFFGEAGDKYILNWGGIRGTPNAISNFFYYAGHGALKRGEVDGQGINKHHEFYLHIGKANQANEGQDYGRLAAKPPLALATGEWNCSTDVFGPLAPRPSESKYEKIVDRIFDLGQEAQDSFGDYGWWLFGSGPHYSYQWDAETQRHYADPRRFEYHTYQKETQLWWCYLRGGERKFYEWAFPSEDHWIDIATTHVPLTFHCDWRGGFRHPQTLHFRPGDWSIDSAMHYIRQRDSAEAWLRGGSQYWASYHRTLETTTLAYYLTGDERYNDVLNYWRDYWSDLAGKTNASKDFQPWHREQPWYHPAEPGEPEKSWAEMIRDYCPFTSGLRHQMTQFFNLATLYEHTRDPKIKQVLEECADAYLDPKHRIGVWRTQENGLPAHADAPLLCHFWVPALWKYHRATGDSRMPEIFRRYFQASRLADPFEEDLGVYSNVHHAYGYYFTKNPIHLRSAKIELEDLLPNGEPLARPEDLNRRLYNPYAPIESLTAVPRLRWALEEAKRDGVTIPEPPPLKPQRSPIAVRKARGAARRVVLWGYDRKLQIIGPNGQLFDDAQTTTEEASSEIQPFDRKLRNFEVYRHEVLIPAAAADGYYLFVPKLELAVLKAPTDGGLVCSCSVPISLNPNESFWWKVVPGADMLKLQSANPTALKLAAADGQPIPTKVNQSELESDLSGVDLVRIINDDKRRKVWFQVTSFPVESCWVSPSATYPGTLPTADQSAKAMEVGGYFRAPKPSEEPFVEGRFGAALRVTPETPLRIPDHVAVDDKEVRLFDLEKGTIEFWIKREWDDRIAAAKPVTYLTNGIVQAWSPWNLPLNEWAHVAVEWRPLKRDPTRQAVHIYVNGRDYRNYRSTWWEGYSQKPLTFPKSKGWLKEFLCAAAVNTQFAMDDLRISSTPRYAKLDIELGGGQVFNPANFVPPQKPFEIDKQTLLLMSFENNLNGASAIIDQPIRGSFAPR